MTNKEMCKENQNMNKKLRDTKRDLQEENHKALHTSHSL